MGRMVLPSPRVLLLLLLLLFWFVSIVGTYLSLARLSCGSRIFDPSPPAEPLATFVVFAVYH